MFPFLCMDAFKAKLLSPLCESTATNSHFPFRLHHYLVPRAREEAFEGHRAPRSWKRGLHHAAHEGVNKGWGDLATPFYLLQNLQQQSVIRSDTQEPMRHLPGRIHPYRFYISLGQWGGVGGGEQVWTQTQL